MQAELIEKIIHLPIEERVEIIEKISRSVREDLLESPIKVSRIVGNAQTALRRDPNVLNRASFQNPAEMPFRFDRMRAAVRIVINDLGIPTPDELPE